MPEFNHPPLKRHPALQPFSRDHYLALVRAKHLVDSADGTTEERHRALMEFRETWNEEIGRHFDDEEAMLLPLSPAELAAELQRQHAELRLLAVQVQDWQEPTAEQVTQLGNLFAAHIRWEEREFFPAIEQAAAPEQLMNLLPQTAAMEAGRNRSRCPTQHKHRT